MAFRFAAWMLAALPAAMAVLTPSEDSFYDPPAGFASEPVGTILKSRTVEASFLGLLPDLDVTTYQLLFRTTAINGSAIAGVTTVFVPYGAMDDRFVSFHTAYDGSSTICDPSYNYQLASVQADIISDVEMLLLEVYLLSGYIVSSPDYEGPDAAFAAGPLSGMVVLDSMRAVSSFSTLGFSTDTPAVVGYGYSGGGIATGWAASLQSTYAPDLPIKGWASGGTPANITGTFLFNDGTVTAGFLLAGIDGLSKPSAYGATFAPFVADIVTTYGKQQLDFAEATCGVEDLIEFAGGVILSTAFQSYGDELLYQPDVYDILDQLIMGANATLTPTSPVYLYHSLDDEIIPYLNASTLYNSWCADGASVEFVTYDHGGHFTAEIIGFPGAFEFVESAFAGTTSSGCSAVSEVTDSLSPLALGLDLEPLLVSLLDALVDLGPKDVNVLDDLEVLLTTVAAPTATATATAAARA